MSCRKMSLERVAIVVNSPVLKQQATQISHDTMTSKYDRIIDASKNSDWENVAIAWVTDGVEPVKLSLEEEKQF